MVELRILASSSNPWQSCDEMSRVATRCPELRVSNDSLRSKLKNLRHGGTVGLVTGFGFGAQTD